MSIKVIEPEQASRIKAKASQVYNQWKGQLMADVQAQFDKHGGKANTPPEETAELINSYASAANQFFKLMKQIGKEGDLNMTECEKKVRDRIDPVLLQQVIVENNLDPEAESTWKQLWPLAIWAGDDTEWPGDEP